MKSQQKQSTDRLAVLLAGGGARCRRLVGELSPNDDVLGSLAGDCRLQPLKKTAASMLGRETEAVLERIGRAGWRWTVSGDADYPQLLQELTDPPLGLFVRGRLGAETAVAVVGSRKASSYGREVTRLLVAELAAAGLTVVSGMARGIDAEAHQAALAAGGRTIAVWGTGPDRVYPPEHGELAEQIAVGGALVTEYLPGTPPKRYHFPERNRVIAGLCRAVVVVEAAVRSGALVTARLALEEGREVLAVPGSILSDLSVGPNALIRMGARPLLTPRDIHDALGTCAPDTQPTRPGATGDSENELLQRGEVLAVDEIASRAGLEISEILERLLELELEGRVERLPDDRYRGRG